MIARLLARLGRCPDCWHRFSGHVHDADLGCTVAGCPCRRTCPCQEPRR